MVSVTAKRQLLRRASLLACAAIVAGSLASQATAVAAAWVPGGWKRDTTPPSTPANLRPSDATAATVTFAWEASTDDSRVAGYDVYVGSSGTPAHVSSLSYTVTGRPCGTSVNVKVAAYDRAGNRSAPATAMGSTSPCPDGQPPSDPTNLDVTARTDTTLTLSWAPSTDAVAVEGYRYYLGTTYIGTTTATTAVFSALTCGTTYTLGVSAVDAAGNVSATTTTTASTTACPAPDDTTPPSAPSYLTASSWTQTGVSLSWAASADDVGVVGYEVYAGGTRVGSTSSTSFALVDVLTCGTGYTLSVDAYDAAGNTSSRASISGSTAACSSSGAPAPIAGQGYREVFRDDFNGLALDATKWHPHTFWNGEMIPGTVTVHDGMVSLLNRRADGFPDSVDIASGPEWSGPQPKTWNDWQFGYFETRMRYTDAKGAWPAFWLSSTAHAIANWPNCPEPDLNYELDIFEGQGDEPFNYYGTQHRNTGGVCGTPDATAATFKTVANRIAGGWHKFAALWTATSVTYYLDDQPLGTNALLDSGDQPMYLILSMYACGWDGTNSCDGSTPDNLVLDADYVTVWQK